MTRFKCRKSALAYLSLKQNIKITKFNRTFYSARSKCPPFALMQAHSLTRLWKLTIDVLIASCGWQLVPLSEALSPCCGFRRSNLSASSTKHGCFCSCNLDRNKLIYIHRGMLTSKQRIKSGESRTIYATFRNIVQNLFCLCPVTIFSFNNR